jgi:hypothetical protein
MENENKYIWSNFKKGTYSKLGSDIPSEEYNTIPFKNIVISDEAFILNFYQDYKKVIIPIEIETLLKSLLAKYGLSKFLEEFIILSCASQKSFIVSKGIKEDLKHNVLLQDFETSKKDYTEFLKIIKAYLFSKTKNNIHSISFKFNSSPTVPITNFFVLDDVYEAICKGFGITTENFEERKEELLNLTNKVSLSRSSEKVKTSIVTNLYEFILKGGNNHSDSLRFVGCFLHISQIPSNTSEREKERERDIDLDNNIDSFLKSIEIKNLNHYIKRQKKFNL